jgi:hypothetical protein
MKKEAFLLLAGWEEEKYPSGTSTGYWLDPKKDVNLREAWCSLEDAYCRVLREQS